MKTYFQPIPNIIFWVNMELHKQEVERTSAHRVIYKIITDPHILLKSLETFNKISSQMDIYIEGHGILCPYDQIH